MNTNRIYSSPESAAYALGVSVKDIWFHCDRWTKYIKFDIKLKWYAFYLQETPKNLVVEHIKPEPIYMEKKNSLSDDLRRQGVGITQYLGNFKFYYRMIWWLLGDEEKKNILSNWIPVYKLAEMMYTEALSKQYIDSSVAFKFTPRGVSKHLRSRFEYYKSWLNMEFQEMYDKDHKEWMLHLRIRYTEDILPPDTVSDRGAFNSIIDPDDPYTGTITANSKPVIWLEAGHVYASISIASRVLRIPRSHIVWCCEGDIDCIVTDLVPKTFRYVKFTNLVPGKNSGKDYSAIRREYGK
jgi:hypothetical protein